MFLSDYVSHGNFIKDTKPPTFISWVNKILEITYQGKYVREFQCA